MCNKPSSSPRESQKTSTSAHCETKRPATTAPPKVGPADGRDPAIRPANRLRRRRTCHPPRPLLRGMRGWQQCGCPTRTSAGQTRAEHARPTAALAYPVEGAWSVFF